MLIDKSKATDVVTSAVQQGGGTDDKAKAGGVFAIQCHDKDGNLKWEAESHNLVVNVGLQDMNAKYFTGSSYTAAWYLGLYGAGASNSPAASDTMSSHAGWTEVTAYSQATRPACTFGTPTTADPSVIDNSGSPSSFAMLVNGTVVAGAFLCSVASGTSGILFSAGDFTGGDKTVDSGDTLNVTYSFSLDAA